MSEVQTNVDQLHAEVRQQQVRYGGNENDILNLSKTFETLRGIFEVLRNARREKQDWFVAQQPKLAPLQAQQWPNQGSGVPSTITMAINQSLTNRTCVLSMTNSFHPKRQQLALSSVLLNGICCRLRQPTAQYFERTLRRASRRSSLAQEAAPTMSSCRSSTWITGTNSCSVATRRRRSGSMSPVAPLKPSERRLDGAGHQRQHAHRAQHRDHPNANRDDEHCL
mmetsp:Transcript_30362/g.63861  ORF Transcript_30362/g.63861 Transcript_30362/m.63861 type:complete len:224 (+) Transcript_30362:201-872(+)